MKRLLAVAILLLAACGPVPNRAIHIQVFHGPARGSKIKCAVSPGQAMVDPIVHHNETPPVGHMHTFFGSTAILAAQRPDSVSYFDLLGGGTNCLNKDDTSGYWSPTVYFKDGTPVPIRAMRAYYRTFDTNTTGPPEDAHPFPPDTRLVAGPGGPATGWWCGQFEGVPLQDSLPTCHGQDKPGHEMAAHVTFPSCWDGVLPHHTPLDVGNTTDDAHYAYPVRNVARWDCPPGFPVRMVQLRQDITYAFWEGDASQELTLASDMMFMTSQGRSLHGDFWNAWDQTGFAQMIADCITSGRQQLASARECS